MSNNPLRLGNRACVPCCVSNNCGDLSRGSNSIGKVINEVTKIQEELGNLVAGDNTQIQYNAN